MANLPLENLGMAGLETDKKSFEISPEAWSASQNMRFNALGAQKFTGNLLVYASTMLHAPYWLFPWKSSTGFSWLYVGLTRLGRVVGVVHTDVTRFTTTLGDDNYAATAASIFSGTLLGDLPVWCYDGEVDPPQSWNAANSRFEDLPNWQASTFADIITVADRHLVAMRVKKSAIAFNPRMVKWSSPADPGTYPNSWDEASFSGAGEVTLAETEGEIMTSALLGKTTLIYKQDSVISMRFVGGQSIFAFDTIFSEFGAISREAVGVLESSHFVVVEGDVIVHNGQSFKSVINNRNRKLLFNFMDSALTGHVQVKVYEQLTEVWICYADINNTGFLNKALVWNYTDNTWSPRDLQDFTHIALGFVDTTNVGTAFNDISGTFDTDLGAFDQASATPVFDEMLAADATNSDLLALNFTEQFNGVPMTCKAERTSLAVIGRDRQGGWKIDLDSRKFVRRVHPKLKASGPVDFYVGGQEKVDGPVTWQGPFVFDPSVDTHFDPILNTKFFSIKVESATNITWTLFGYTVDLDVIGEAPV